MKRVAVITGTSRGLGVDIAKRLMAKGWTVIGFSRSAGKADFETHQVDVTDHAQVAAAFEKIKAKHGTLDLLVNNAAIFKMAKFTECDVRDMHGIVDTNLKGTMFCTHAALKLLKRPGGKIINVASVSGTHGIPNQAIYVASKHAMVGFADALAQELQAEGITVSTLCPGGIDTPLWDPKTNPYPGDKKALLPSDDVAKVVELCAELPNSVTMKKIVMFPSNEWH